VTNDRIDPKALGIVGVRVSRETTVDRLAEETREAVAGVLAAARFGEPPARFTREPEDLVKLSVGQEPGVTRDTRPMELELQPAEFVVYGAPGLHPKRRTGRLGRPPRLLV
jgi:hypothetical protein